MGKGMMMAVVTLVGVAAQDVAGQQSGDGRSDTAETAARAIATAVRAPVDVRVDGLDTDPVWAAASPITALRQFDPEPDADPSFPTEIRVAYDEDDLFVLVRAFDAHPDSIMRALTRRDVRGPSDQIGLFIDSYRDRRSGYFFIVNPDGVKRDLAIYDDGNMDSSWDAVWDVAVQVDSLGWIAEFRIPLSQLRFADADEHVFGFGVRRTIERYSEMSQWPLYSETTPGLVSQLGELHGLEGLGSADRFELVPYAVTKNVTRATAGGFDHPQEYTVGGDLKVGITPNVTLNATVNPDFGQVEADPAVLNLTAFETFFSERRPFFVEGTGLYSFSLNCYIVVDCNTNEGLFYSRRIGRSPSLRGLHGDDTTPTSTPIAGAAKLTGRTGSGLSFGILDAVTRSVDGTGGRTSEPAANHAVVRVTQDLRDGDAGFGVIGTAVNRSLDASTDPYLHESAYVAGADARARFGERNYQISSSVAVSRVAGSPEAMVRTQTGRVHYYQQPGDGVAVDSAATSLTGYMAQVKVGKYGGGITRFESSLVRQSRGFDVNDLGFLRRADITDWSTWAALSFQEGGSWYRWAQVNGNVWNHWNSAGRRIESAVNFNGHLGLHNNWDFHMGGTMGRLGGAVCDRCTRGGPVLRRDVSFFPWGGFNSDSRKTVSGGWWTNLGFWDAGRSHSVSLSPYVTFRPSTSLSGTLGVRYYTADDNTQWFGNFTEAGETHYAFAHLDQRTVSVNLRVNYTATPNLTFEFYGEPLTSSGTYSDIREISATPEAEAYDQRFRAFAPPGGAATRFTFSQLRTNAVVRWEYLPGSTIFLVWAHGREAFLAGEPRQAWHADFRDLLDQDADNTFLVKVAYWFNR